MGASRASLARLARLALGLALLLLLSSLAASASSASAEEGALPPGVTSRVVIDAETGRETKTLEFDSTAATDLANLVVDLANGRRDLAPTPCVGSTDPWCIVNEYFRSPSTGYIGENPGPCPGSSFTPGKCEGWACQMSPTFKQTPLPPSIPVIGGKQIQEVIHCDDCANWPGIVNLYTLSFGALQVGNIVLGFDSEFTQSPSLGWNQQACPPPVPSPTGPVTPDCFRPPTPSPNAIRMSLKLYAVKFDAYLHVDTYLVRSKSFTVLVIITVPEITFSFNGIEVSLTKNDQGNGVYFQTAFVFYSNLQCPLKGGGATLQVNPTTGLNDRCIQMPGFYYPPLTPTASGYYFPETFQGGFVYSMNYITKNGGAQYDDAVSCNWNVDGNEADFGLSLDLGIPTGIFSFLRPAVNWIVTLIVNAVIKGILCQLLLSMAYAVDDSLNIRYSEPGIWNNGLGRLYDGLRIEVEQGLSNATTSDFAEDVRVPNYFFSQGWPLSTWPLKAPGWRPFPGAVDFNNSKTFKAVSLGLNGLLGNKSTTPGYENKLVIVEVLDILLANKDGIVPLGDCTGYNPDGTYGYQPGPCYNDIKAQLDLDNYPQYIWGDEPYRTPKTASPSTGTNRRGGPWGDIWWPAKFHNQQRAGGLLMFNGIVQLTQLQFRSVNSITSFFILDNGFQDGVPRHTHIVENNIGLDRFEARATIRMTLRDGYWMHRPNAATWPGTQNPGGVLNKPYFPPVTGTMNVDFTLNLVLRTIVAKFDLMALFVPDGLSPYKVGQILGSGLLLTERVKCASFGVNWMELERLQVAGTLDTITLNNFFGTGVGGLIASGTEVVKRGFTPATQQYLPYIADNWVKRKANSFLTKSTFIGPYTRQHANSSCKPTFDYYFTEAKGNYGERYINFTGSKAWYALRGAINNLIGGTPVRTGSAAINSIIQAYLEWYITRLKSVTVVAVCDSSFANPAERWYNVTANSFPCEGNWDVLDGKLELVGTPAVDKYLRFSNLRVRNLDSIHELTVLPTGDHTLKVRVKVGGGSGGKIYDRTRFALYDPGFLTFALNMDLSVVTLIDGVTYSFAEESVTFAIRFGNLTVDTDISLLINQNKGLDLYFSNLNKLACLLTVLEDSYMSTLNIGFYSFRLYVDHYKRSRADCPTTKTWNPATPTVQGACGDSKRIVRMSDALDYLAWESSVGATGTGWGPKVDNMLLYIFKGISNQTKNVYNNFDGLGGSVQGCETRSVFGKVNVIGFLKGLLNNATGNVTRNDLSKLTADQENPRFPRYRTQGTAQTLYVPGDWGYPALGGRSLCALKTYGTRDGACWEERVPYLDPGRFDLRNNAIVKAVQGFINKQTAKVYNQGLKALSTFTPLVLAYTNGTTTPDGRTCNVGSGANGFYCVDIDVTDLAPLIGINVSTPSNFFLPGFIINPRRLFIQDVHTLDVSKLELLKNYVRYDYDPPDTDAIFTLQHRIAFQTLNVRLEVDVSVDEIFVNATTKTPYKQLTDTIQLDFRFKNLDLQLMTMTAINKTRFETIPIAKLLNPKASDCFFSMFFNHGLYLPQLQLYVQGLDGPTVTIYPRNDTFPYKAPLIFSGAVGALISASIEIVFQLLRDDFQDVTQGYLRGKVNDALQLIVENAVSANGGSGTDKCLILDDSELCDWGTASLPANQRNYINFLGDCASKGIRLFNKFLGGDPITSSQLDLNHLLDFALNYALVEKKALDPVVVVKKDAGQYVIPDVSYYSNGASYFNISNVQLLDIDSIYKAVMANYPGYTPPRYFDVGLNLSLGGGTYLDGSFVPAQPALMPPLGLGVDFDARVRVNRPGVGVVTIADDAFRVLMQLTGLDINTVLELYVARDRFAGLTFAQVTNPQCFRSIITKAEVDALTLAVADLNVFVANFTTFGRKFGKLGQSIDALRADADRTNLPVPPAKSKPTHMLNVMVRNIGQTIANVVSASDFFNQTLRGCENAVAHFEILSGTCGGVNTESITALTTKLAKVVPGIVRSADGVVGPTINADGSSLRVPYSPAGYASASQFADAVIAAAANKLNTSIPIKLRRGSPCTDLNIGSALKSVCSAVAGTSGKNFTQVWKDFVAPQQNLIDIGFPAENIEAGVKIDYNLDPYYDVRKSKLVSTVTTYFDKSASTWAQLLRSVANQTDLLTLEPDNSVSLTANVTDLMFLLDNRIFNAKSCDGRAKNNTFLLQNLLKTSNFVIPGLRFLPGNLYIKNFGEFTDITVFRPYPNARFTTQSAFGWRNSNKPLIISIDLDMFVDSWFTNPALTKPSGVEVKETITISLNITNLYIQVLTMLAVNPVKLGSTSLSNFLSVDEFQVFTRNCNAISCLVKAVYPNGASIPQLTLNVTDIQGPVIKTKSNQIFTVGLELFVSAVAEIFVQIFRDNFANIFNGPLRTNLNNRISKFLDQSCNPDACPARRNYTKDYPLGEFYCSHVDRKGILPARTQNRLACESKNNNKTCVYSPPDQAYSINQTQCFYDKRALDLDFSRAKDLRRLQSFINSSLLNPDSVFNVNNILNVLVGSITTKWYETKPPLKISYNGNSFGTVTAGVGRFRFAGFNTVDRLQIFDNRPYDPINGPLRFKGTTATTTSSGRRQLALNVGSRYGPDDNNYTTRSAIGMTGRTTIGFELYLSFDALFLPRADNPSGVVTDHLKFSLLLDRIDIVIDLFMLVNIPRLMDLEIRSIATIYELPCILAIFEREGLVPVNFNMTFGRVGFEICCASTCNSPYFKPLETACFSDAANNQLTKAFTGAFNSWVRIVIDYVASTRAQDFLDARISTSISQCEAIKAGLPTLPALTKQATVPAASYMGIAGLAAIFSALAAFAMLVPVHYRRRDDLMKRALLDAHERGAAGKSKEEFELAERRLASAFAHPTMPNWVKFGVPVSILISVIMFATANFAAPGATVEITIAIAGDQTVPIPLLPFTLEQSINDMWNAGVYPLAIIIALASGGWPYAKLLLLLFSWFAPATILHPRARGRLLEILDLLGKWSLIDVYVLVMLMVAFYFFLSSSMVEKLSLIPTDALTVTVTVTPGWGIFGFLFGAMGSLLVNHVMVYWHRKCIRSDEDLQDAILGQLVKDLRTPRIPLMRHRFNILDQEGRPYRYSALVRVVFIAIWALLFIIIIVGSVVPVIRFTFQGVAGLAFGFISPDLGSSVYSTASLATSIMRSAKPTIASVLSIVFLQIIFLMFALITPLMLCVAFIVLWAVPLTLQEQILLGFVCEIIWAWEALMVLVFSVIAAIFQISQLAQFIVNYATGSLCELAKAPLAKIFPDPTDAQCFNVIASLEPSGAIIVVAGLLLLFWTPLSWYLVEAALDDRELAMRRHPPVSPGEMRGIKGFLVRRALEAFGPSTGRIEADVDTMNMFAQQVGAYDTKSMTPSGQFTGMPMYGAAQPSGMYGMTPSMGMNPAGGDVGGNPIMARESGQMMAANPMFGSVPGASASKPDTRRVSVEV